MVAAPVYEISSSVLGMGLPEKLLLQHEVEQFFYEESSLLDQRMYKEWLDLCAPDIHYWIPIRRTVTLKDSDREFTGPSDMAYYNDNKMSLEMRVNKLYTGTSWSEDPPSRTRHNVTNLRILDVEGDEITTECNLHLYRSRLESEVDEWTGRRIDKIRRKDDSFELVMRHVYLDQTIIRATNMSSLF